MPADEPWMETGGLSEKRSLQRKDGGLEVSCGIAVIRRRNRNNHLASRGDLEAQISILCRNLRPDDARRQNSLRCDSIEWNLRIARMRRRPLPLRPQIGRASCPGR